MNINRRIAQITNQSGKCLFRADHISAACTVHRTGRGCCQYSGNRYLLIARSCMKDYRISDIPVYAILISNQNTICIFHSRRDTALIQFFFRPPELVIIVGNERDGSFSHIRGNRKASHFHTAKNFVNTFRFADPFHQRPVQRRISHCNRYIRCRWRECRHPLIEKDYHYLKRQEHHNTNSKRAGHKEYILFAGQCMENSHAGFNVEQLCICSPFILRKL